MQHRQARDSRVGKLAAPKSRTKWKEISNGANSKETSNGATSKGAEPPAVLCVRACVRGGRKQRALSPPPPSPPPSTPVALPASNLPVEQPGKEGIEGGRAIFDYISDDLAVIT
jgi:hypothetical protein